MNVGYNVVGVGTVANIGAVSPDNNHVLQPND